MDLLKSISVVMATYNGEKYIYEQLESIAKQTCSPSEVLIFDDGSNDMTVQIIKDYIENNHLNNWCLYINAKNKGWKKNFIDGLKTVKGDIVFTADQDDVWHPEKIQIMTEILEKEPSAQIAMCNYKRFFGNDYGSYDVTTGKYHIRMSMPKNAEVAFPGCSYAFRRDFFMKICSAWIDNYAHDLLLYLAGWMSDSTIVCEDTLLYFRRHNESATFISAPMLDKSTRIQWINSNYVVMNKLSKIFRDENCEYVNTRMNWLKDRKSALEERSLFLWIKLIRYLRYYPTVRTWFGDGLTILKR